MEISIEQAVRSEEKSLGRLVEEHRQYSRQLEAILAQSHPNETDQIEAARLKKLKLKLKDEIERQARPAMTA
jgi:hypothetical protein